MENTDLVSVTKNLTDLKTALLKAHEEYQGDWKNEPIYHYFPNWVKHSSNMETLHFRTLLLCNFLDSNSSLMKGSKNLIFPFPQLISIISYSTLASSLRDLLKSVPKPNSDDTPISMESVAETGSSTQPNELSQNALDLWLEGIKVEIKNIHTIYKPKWYGLGWAQDPYFKEIPALIEQVRSPLELKFILNLYIQYLKSNSTLNKVISGLGGLAQTVISTFTGSHLAQSLTEIENKITNEKIESLKCENLNIIEVSEVNNFSNISEFTEIKDDQVIQAPLVSQPVKCPAVTTAPSTNLPQDLKIVQESSTAPCETNIENGPTHENSNKITPTQSEESGIICEKASEEKKEGDGNLKPSSSIKEAIKKFAKEHELAAEAEKKKLKRERELKKKRSEISKTLERRRLEVQSLETQQKMIEEAEQRVRASSSGSLDHTNSAPIQIKKEKERDLTKNSSDDSSDSENIFDKIGKFFSFKSSPPKGLIENSKTPKSEEQTTPGIRRPSLSSK